MEGKKGGYFKGKNTNLEHDKLIMGHKTYQHQRNTNQNGFSEGLSCQVKRKSDVLFQDEWIKIEFSLIPWQVFAHYKEC